MSNPSRQKFSSRHFVVPVVLYAIIFNLPKFFELKTSCTIPERPFSNRYNFQLDRKETKFASVPQWHHLLRSIFKCLKTAVSRVGPVVQMSTRRFNWRRARFEQTVGTMSILYIFTGTVFDAIVFCIKRSLMTMTIRKTRRYLNIYMLWLSTIFNIILPIVSLVLLNTFITRWTFSSSFHARCSMPCNTSA